MSVSDIRAFTPSDVNAIFPFDLKQSEPEINGGLDRSCRIELMVAGIFIILTGLYIALAAHGVIPGSINVIGAESILGQAVGYVATILGAVLAVFSVARKRQTPEENPSKKSPIELTLDSLKKDKVTRRLQSHELLVLDDPEKKEIYISYQQWDAEEKQQTLKTDGPLPYTEDSKEAYANWSAKHVELAEDKKFIELSGLKGRQELFKEESSFPSKSEHFNVPFSIPKEVLTTLDQLFEGIGGVEHIPAYNQIIKNEAIPEASQMKRPIIKAVMQNPGKLDDQRAIILIKLRCISSEAEIQKAFSLSEGEIEALDLENYVRTVNLCQHFKPLQWFQQQTKGPYYPQFFGTNIFTDADNGKCVQPDAFAKLQNLIRNGSGEDSLGLKWEIAY